jgi:hypothetical protein
LRYTDPSGHEICYEDGYCLQKGSSADDLASNWAAYYGIKIKGDWSTKDKWSILLGAMAIGSAFSDVIGYINPNTAFQDVFGSLTFTLNSGAKDGNWSCEASAYGFSCDPDASGEIDVRLIAHELGHAFNWIISYAGQVTPYDDLRAASIRDDDGAWVTGIKDNGVWERGYSGYKSRGRPDLYHGPDDWHDAATGSPNEEYADMFMNWVFNSFDYSVNVNGAGTARYTWMTANMTEWIGRARR